MKSQKRCWKLQVLGLKKVLAEIRQIVHFCSKSQHGEVLSKGADILPKGVLQSCH